MWQCRVYACDYHSHIIIHYWCSSNSSMLNLLLWRKTLRRCFPQNLSALVLMFTWSTRVLPAAPTPSTQTSVLLWMPWKVTVTSVQPSQWPVSRIQLNFHKSTTSTCFIVMSLSLSSCPALLRAHSGMEETLMVAMVIVGWTALVYGCSWGCWWRT